MLFDEIYKDVVSSFGKLWQYKERGKSLEIITPFATTSQKFISVFLTKQDGYFIISDGGWLRSNLYDNTFNLEDEIYKRIVLHYGNSYDVKEVKDATGKTFYYKKTSNSIAVPSLVYDLANFISSLVSLGDIEYTEKMEKAVKERFRKMANSYLQSFVPKEVLNLQGYLDEKKVLRFSAIVTYSPSKVILINYVTGSTPQYFRDNAFKAGGLFLMADETPYSNYITRKISVIDNTASGYHPEFLAPFINHLVHKTHSDKVDWSEREKIKSLV